MSTFWIGIVGEARSVQQEIIVTQRERLSGLISGSHISCHFNFGQKNVSKKYVISHISKCNRLCDFTHVSVTSHNKIFVWIHTKNAFELTALSLKCLQSMPRYVGTSRTYTIVWNHTNRFVWNHTICFREKDVTGIEPEPWCLYIQCTALTTKPVLTTITSKVHYLSTIILVTFKFKTQMRENEFECKKMAFFTP